MCPDQQVSGMSEQTPCSENGRWSSKASSKIDWQRVDPRAVVFGCSSCGALVREFDRDKHEQDHAERAGLVIDLRDKVAR